MYKKHQSRIRKFMANKSFIFFTGLLSLSLTGNAYSWNTSVSVKNNIPSKNPYYSKKGYTVQSVGTGTCIKHVHPTSYTSVYGAAYGKIGINFYDVGDESCKNFFASKNFNVINNDTGKVAGNFRWGHSFRVDGDHITLYKNPGNFMVVVAKYKKDQNNKLNLRISH
ncbi:hypothetical protein [Candidatus Sororendozoicomonas aggregata]|uniref:hypothetical protein n=1 Tax=Candidatus Sororendozoicomonas aggregata TaxID=3073239 RepID=UPI002ED2278C